MNSGLSKVLQVPVLQIMFHSEFLVVHKLWLGKKMEKLELELLGKTVIEVKKENLSKKFNIMSVLNLGPHSYQYDVNRFSDPFLEILISKSAKIYINKVFKLSLIHI